MIETRVNQRREFDVWNQVPLVPQLTGMSCWAAAAAMVIGWRDVIAVDPEEVASGAGHWAEYVDGLHPHQLEAFARAWGLVVVRDFTWSLDAVRRLLEQFGPLWLGEASPGLHSIVVTGIHGDGTHEATQVRVNDPWPVGRGERYTLTWTQLTENFHAATDLGGAHVQILHAGGRRGGPSGRYHFEERRSVRTSIERYPPDQDETMYTTHGPRHHEEYPGHAMSTPENGASTVPAGSAHISTSIAVPDPLAEHGGSGENLCLIWNDLGAAPSVVDVVVHLHGYSSRPPDAAMLQAKVATSGVELAGRSRPTLAIIPRGRRITPAEIEANPKANPNRYTFPALLAENGQGLERIILLALSYVRDDLVGRGSSPSVGRRILTAHSGGGAALNALLASHATCAACDPHEVHVFDALYGNTAGITSWATARVERDRVLSADQLASEGGGLRIVYRDGTAVGSLAVAGGLPASGDALYPAYRADTTTAAHERVAAIHGPMLLADVRADLATAAAAQGVHTHASAYGAPMGLIQSYRNRPPIGGGNGTATGDGGARGTAGGIGVTNAPPNGSLAANGAGSSNGSANGGGESGYVRPSAPAPSGANGGTGVGWQVHQDAVAGSDAAVSWSLPRMEGAKLPNDDAAHDHGPWISSAVRLTHAAEDSAGTIGASFDLQHMTNGNSVGFVQIVPAGDNGAVTAAQSAVPPESIPGTNGTRAGAPPAAPAPSSPEPAASEPSAGPRLVVTGEIIPDASAYTRGDAKDLAMVQVLVHWHYPQSVGSDRYDTIVKVFGDGHVEQETEALQGTAVAAPSSW